MAESIMRTVRVTIEKEIEIELTPSVFGPMTEEEYLAEFRNGLWHVDGMDDVVKYAAEMAACHGSGYNHDGIGTVAYAHTTYPSVPDVKFREIYSECETEIIERPATQEGGDKEGDKP